MLSIEAKERLLDHPELFLLYYFPHRLEVLKDFHIELIEIATRERRGLELFPATHGKTTLISELIPIYEICKDPNIRLAGIFKNDGDARAITRSIQAELTTNEELIEDFGPFIVEKGEGQGRLWTQNRFDVANRTRKGKSSTWAAFGAGSRDALGYRTDHTICDDIVTDLNSSTEQQRDKLRQWFFQGPMTGPDKEDGRITVVGTVFHPGDLYHELMASQHPTENRPIWTSRVQRAVLDWDTEQVLWPEERPFSMLMEFKSQGTLDFNKRYQNVAVDPSQMTFREEYVRGGYIGGNKFPGCLDSHYRIEEFDPDWKIYIGFDPAVGVYRGHKFCALVVLGLGSCTEHERCWWIVDVIRDQMTLPRQVEVIIDQMVKYSPAMTKIEANVFQAGLYQQVQQKMDEQGIFYPCEPHYTNRQNKPDPETGVMAMSTMVEKGQLHIPQGDAASRQRMRVFIDEMITYPGATTDTVMALWFAWRATTGSAPRYKTANRFEREYTLKWPQPRPYGVQVLKNPFYATEEA